MAEDMEQAKERLRQGYEAFNRGDFDESAKYIHPDVDWHRVADVEQRLEGREAVRGNMEPEVWGKQRVEIHAMEVFGESVVMDTTFHAEGSRQRHRDRSARVPPLEDAGRHGRPVPVLQRAGRGGEGGSRAGGPVRVAPAASRRPYPVHPHGTHPELLDHRPHRPRQVDARGPHPRADRGRRRALARAADARLDGARARARDHDQGAGGPRRLPGGRRPDLPPAPDRHPGARGLLLRGLAQPRRLRGRSAGRRRRPGRRGPDRRQRLRRRSRPGSR